MPIDPATQELIAMMDSREKGIADIKARFERWVADAWFTSPEDERMIEKARKRIDRLYDRFGPKET